MAPVHLRPITGGFPHAGAPNRPKVPHPHIGIPGFRFGALETPPCGRFGKGCPVLEKEKSGFPSYPEGPHGHLAAPRCGWFPPTSTAVLQRLVLASAGPVGRLDDSLTRMNRLDSTFQFSLVCSLRLDSQTHPLVVGGSDPPTSGWVWRGI